MKDEELKEYYKSYFPENSSTQPFLFFNSLLQSKNLIYRAGKA